MTDEELIEEIEAQRSIMTSVSTGGYNSIPYVNDEYKEHRRRIHTALQERGISDPNPFFDLRRWYDKWSSGDLPSYQSRRRYINDMYDSLVERVQQGSILGGTTLFDEPTGWARVDRGIEKAISALETASGEEEFQTVGLLCRETLISLAQAVFDPAIHIPLDGTDPSDTDAKRMLDAYIATELAGGSNEELRQHAKAALKLADALQHRRTATFREAALCTEATRSVINLIAIVSGIRDPD